MEIAQIEWKSTDLEYKFQIASKERKLNKKRKLFENQFKLHLDKHKLFEKQFKLHLD